MGKSISLLILLLFLQACSLSYVIKQGAYQMELLSGSEPIAVALRDPKLDPKMRQKLELIQDVRAFAKSQLKLVVHRNYQDVNISWQRIIHTVSASKPFKFEPYTWWFPLIGSVPYKGFFDEKDADQEEQRLSSLGLETQKRKVHGYSTLGYFADPVWPAMLSLSDDDLIELIIHELAHATIYLPNQTPFNETFASFMGELGAKAYLIYRFGPKNTRLEEREARQRELKTYHAFFTALYRDLDQLYESSLDLETIKTTKLKILDDAKNRYRDLSLSDSFRDINWSRINNAFLLLFKSYHHDDQIFLDLFLLSNKDIAHFLNEVKIYSKGSEPFASLKERIQFLRDQH